MEGESKWMECIQRRRQVDGVHSKAKASGWSAIKGESKSDGVQVIQEWKTSNFVTKDSNALDRHTA